MLVEIDVVRARFRVQGLHTIYALTSTGWHGIGLTGSKATYLAHAMGACGYDQRLRSDVVTAHKALLLELVHSLADWTLITQLADELADAAMPQSTEAIARALGLPDPHVLRKWRYDRTLPFEPAYQFGEQVAGASKWMMTPMQVHEWVAWRQGLRSAKKGK
jgi:hypothetical protein